MVQTDAFPHSMMFHYTMPSTIAFDTKGNVVVVGAGGDGSDYSATLAMRYLSDGTLDPSFNGSYPELLSAGVDKISSAIALLIDGRGRLVLTGATAIDLYGVPQMVAFRINDDGTPDLSFGDGAGFKRLSSDIYGGTSAFTHDGDIVTYGFSSDGSALVWNEIVGYDLPPVMPPSGF